MKISDMIELAQAGYKAKDVLTLHKAGYTKEMIVELSEEPEETPEVPENDSKPNTEESTPDEEAITNKEEKQDNSENNPALIELEKVKKELAELQERNRHKDISGTEPEDPNKHIKEYIASLM